ncbi:hypothetical protein [Parvularcula bermudensis]|nr:hypothetical protein [Parvularcula bermudensis]
MTGLAERAVGRNDYGEALERISPCRIGPHRQVIVNIWYGISDPDGL